ncbi:pilus assembly protein [Sphingomonas piscis]|uniref:Pilus assembly protein n=1 Tax=Sphingomonas piscis TaxID=2714943 RepID=A0A6G7YS12_9SPHN|nr:TadE family protein [Sphingomonas piscis]QIK79527.1 pilus assembly protein [Sphingomonas piscis]
MKRLRHFVGCESGTSVIELALILPTFAAFLIGIAEFSRAFSEKLQLEQAAQRAVEKVQQYQASTSTFSTMKAEAATAAGVTATASNPTVEWWLECDGVRQSSYNNPCSTTGAIEARWIEVRITKTYTPMFPSRVWPGANSDGTFTLVGEAGVRTQ